MGRIYFCARAELVVLAGEHGVHQDAHQSGHSQAGQTDGDGAHGDGDGTGVVHAHGQTHDHGGNQNVAALGEVHLVFNHVPDAHGGDHAVQHQADAAHGSGRHGNDQCGKLGAEGQDNGEHGGQTDNLGVVHLAQGQNAGVFTIGGVGGSAEEGGHGGCQTVAYQSAVQAGILYEVLAHGGGDGADIANMLHHGSQGDGHDGHNGGDQQAGVQIAAEDGQGGVVPYDGQADPVCLADQGHQICPGGGVNDHGEHIGANHTQQDGDDLHHAGKGQADADDDGARDNGGKVAHDLFGAELLEEEGQNQVYETCAGHTEAGIGQGLAAGAQGADGIVAADEGEGGAQEGGDLPPGDQVEQQRAQARKQQGVGHIQACQRGNQNRCAEHGEQMLYAQQQALGDTQGAGVVYCVSIFFRCHFYYILSLFTKRGRKDRCKDFASSSLPFFRYVPTSILSVPENCKFFMAALHPKCEQNMTPLLWKLHDEGASHAANAENEDGNAIMHGADLMNAKMPLMITRTENGIKE